MNHGFFIPFLNRTVRNETNSGTTSSYFKLSPRRGIKIFDFPAYTGPQTEGFKTVSELKKSKAWKFAKEEFLITRYAQRKTKFVVKMHKLIGVKDLRTGRWIPAIMMDHLRGVPLCNTSAKDAYLGRNKISLEGFEYLIKDILKKHRIKHLDLHDENIIIYKKKLTIIDFGQAKKISK